MCPGCTRALPSGLTALHLAAACGSLKTVQILLEYGAQTGTVRMEWRTPLIHAIQHGMSEVAVLLAQNGALDVKDSDGRSALDHAARYGLTEVLAALMDAGCDMSCVDPGSGWNLAHFLARTGQAALLEQAVEDGVVSNAMLAAPDNGGCTPYEVALQNGQAFMAATFESEAWPCATHDPLAGLRYGARYRLDTLFDYLDKGGDASFIFTAPEDPDCGKSLAYLAAESGCHEVLMHLLARGAQTAYSFNGRSRHLLAAAITGGSIKCVDAILKKLTSPPAQVGPDGELALILAVQADNLEMVQALRQRKLPSAVAGEPDKTPLNEAIILGRRDIVKYLLTNVEPDAARAALALAVRKGSTECVPLILAKHPDLDGGEALVPKAIRANQPAVLDQLLEYGALGDKDLGASALGLAASLGRFECVLTLLASGVDPNSLVAGQTPLQAALTNHHFACAEALIERGALSQADTQPAFYVEARRALHTRDRRRLQEILDLAGPSYPLSFTPGSEDDAVLKGYRPLAHQIIACGLGQMLASAPTSYLVADAAGHSGLDVAAALDEVAVLEAARDAGILLSAKNKNGSTPLHTASQQGSTAAIEFLLEAGFNPDDPDAFGRTALHFAISSDAADAVDILLAAGVNVDCISKDGTTPLLLAAQNGDELLVGKLLAHGAHPNLGTFPQTRATPLHEAASRNHHRVVMLLLSQGAAIGKPDGNGDRAIHYAARANALATLRILCSVDQRQLNLANRHGETPLHHAAAGGAMDTLQFLLEKRANRSARRTVDKTAPDAQDLADGVTPLLLAARSGKPEAVRLLHQYHVDFAERDAAERGVHSYAAAGESVDVLRFLDTIGQEGDLTERAQAVAIAAHQNNIPILAFLHQKGVAMDAPALMGMGSGLSAAAGGGHPAATAYLLKCGASPHTLNPNEASPLEEAVMNGRLGPMRLLLEVPGALATKSAQGDTLIHLAVQKNRAAALVLLLLHGAELNASDEAGFTALARAVESGRQDLVEILAGFGANPRLPEKVRASARPHVRGCVAWLDEYCALKERHPSDSRLHIAARMNLRLIGGVLAQIDDPNARNAGGATPMQLVKDPWLRRKLLEYGGVSRAHGNVGEATRI